MADQLNPVQRKLFQLARALGLYHRYRAFGLEHVPAAGPALIAVSHSLATYDALLLARAIYNRTGRAPRGLGDRLIFKTPYLKDWAAASGMEPGSPEAGMRLLIEGNILMMAPGGMLESLRPSAKRYQICWERRRGFVRLAMRAQVPILLAACPRADEIYRVYDTPVTPLVYQALKMPLPIARGIGLTTLPRPVRLVHLVSEPQVPPALESTQGDAFEEQVTKFHASIQARMRELLAEALSL